MGVVASWRISALWRSLTGQGSAIALGLWAWMGGDGSFGAGRPMERPFFRDEGSSHSEHTFASMSTQAESTGAMSHPVRRVATEARGQIGLRSERRRA
jgi:hypothetical protein